MVLFIVARRARRSVSIFMISLVVANFKFAVMAMPFRVLHLVYGSWTLRVLVCKLQIFAYVLLASASILSCCCVTVHRYIKIIFPMRRHIFNNEKNILASLVFLWLYSATTSSFVFIDFSDDSNVFHGEFCSQSVNSKLYVSLFILTYCIPLTIMCGICVHISKISRKHSKNISVHTVPNHPRDNVSIASSRKGKQFFKVHLLLLFFVVCWLPVLILTLALKTRYESEISWPGWARPAFLYLITVGFSSTVIQPMLYACSNKHFKTVLKGYVSRHSPEVAPFATRSSPAYSTRSVLGEQTVTETNSSFATPRNKRAFQEGLPPRIIENFAS